MKEYAIIKLKDGRSMKIELMRECAPISVENFITLAKSGYYDGLIFHRCIPNFMIQGGGMDEKMKEKGGVASIKGEFIANGVANNLKHTIGVISMARTMVKDSATGQFFVCVTNVPHLDGQYAGFGKTADEESAKVAINISTVKTRSAGYHDDVPSTPIVIATIEIVTE